ncbi:MAG: hypothetical protein EP332_10945 [Bacteroidetes bacterium]|nr:MAG: hypothetical protein EP332_10945 [Bacteroidota bacterium]
MELLTPSIGLIFYTILTIALIIGLFFGIKRFVPNSLRLLEIALVVISLTCSAYLKDDQYHFMALLLLILCIICITTIEIVIYTRKD